MNVIDNHNTPNVTLSTSHSQRHTLLHIVYIRSTWSQHLSMHIEYSWKVELYTHDKSEWSGWCYKRWQQEPATHIAHSFTHSVWWFFFTFGNSQCELNRKFSRCRDQESDLVTTWNAMRWSRQPNTFYLWSRYIELSRLLSHRIWVEALPQAQKHNENPILQLSKSLTNYRALSCSSHLIRNSKWLEFFLCSSLITNCSATGVLFIASAGQVSLLRINFTRI